MNCSRYMMNCSPIMMNYSHYMMNFSLYAMSNSPSVCLCSLCMFKCSPYVIDSSQNAMNYSPYVFSSSPFVMYNSPCSNTGISRIAPKKPHPALRRDAVLASKGRAQGVGGIGGIGTNAALTTVGSLVCWRMKGTSINMKPGAVIRSV